MSSWLWAAFAAAAGAGACARYIVDVRVQAATDGVFPFGTLTVNLVGSFVLGIVAEATLRRAAPGQLSFVVGTGFCGAFTTFSTFTYETARLAQDGAVAEAALNLGVSLVAGLAAAAAGMALGSAV